MKTLYIETISNMPQSFCQLMLKLLIEKQLLCTTKRNTSFQPHFHLKEVWKSYTQIKTQLWQRDSNWDPQKALYIKEEVIWVAKYVKYKHCIFSFILGIGNHVVQHWSLIIFQDGIFCHSQKSELVSWGLLCSYFLDNKSTDKEGNWKSSKDGKYNCQGKTCSYT